MDIETQGMDRKYILDHLTVKTYPKPGYDVYLMRLYFKGAYIKQIEVDGLELEMWRYKDDADPDSLTYDEFEEKGMGMPTVKMKTPLERKTREWKEGMKFGKKEENGWD